MVHAGRPTPPLEKSRELQRKLYLAAKRNRKRKFHALYDRIYRPDVLWRVWEEVRRTGGTPVPCKNPIRRLKPGQRDGGSSHE